MDRREFVTKAAALGLIPAVPAVAVSTEPIESLYEDIPIHCFQYGMGYSFKESCGANEMFLIAFFMQHSHVRFRMLGEQTLGRFIRFMTIMRSGPFVNSKNIEIAEGPKFITVDRKGMNGESLQTFALEVILKRGEKWIDVPSFPKPQLRG